MWGQSKSISLSSRPIILLPEEWKNSQNSQRIFQYHVSDLLANLLLEAANGQQVKGSEKFYPT